MAHYLDALPKKPGKGLVVHALLAGIVGPYLVLVVMSFLGLGASIEINPIRYGLIQPFGMLLFGFPIISVFAVLSFFPLLGVLACKRPAVQTRAFLWVGGLLGLLVGIWVVWTGMDSDEGIVMVMATTLIGVLCGYLDHLAWRQPEPKKGEDAAPNMSVSADHDPRERGSRPLNTSR